MKFLGKKIKFSFSKCLAVLVLIWGIRCVEMSYDLAYLKLDTNTTVTVAVITTVIATIISYFTSKTVEKNSLNKYNIKLDDKDNAPV